MRGFKKEFIVIIVLAMAGTVFLFTRPKNVVSTQDRQLAAESAGKENMMPDTLEHQPLTTLPDSLSSVAMELKNKFYGFSDKEKKLIFADSLVVLYESRFVFDSAAYYQGKIVELDNTAENILEAANLYFRAFKVAQNPKIRKDLALQAKGYYNRILEHEPDRYDIQARVAVIMVETETPPMTGVNMLKEIIEKDPNNIEALLSLGEFLFTINKTDKAIQHFKQVIRLDDNNLKAVIYLGEAYRTLGDKASAKNYFEMALEMTENDPVLKEAIQKELFELNKVSN